MGDGNLNGVVLSILISAASGRPMQALEEVRAVAGEGLEGDRYLKGTGLYSGDVEWDSSVTLIEIEAFEAFEREYGIALSPESMRRNLVTKGVSLEKLVGKEFKVGAAVLRGIKPWPPCSYIAKSIGKPEVLPGFKHSGGLGADILKSGVIRVGDVVHLLWK